jgi:hypothetical protein
VDDAAEMLSDYQDALRKMGADPTPLARQAEALAWLPDAELEPALKAFHAAADRQANIFDSDYGALLMEVHGDLCADLQRKARLYDPAGLRAAIYASYATAGGEGLAHSIDVQRINRKIENLGRTTA